MNLHTVLLSYHRLPLTLRAAASYLETVTVPHRLMIVDNGSPPDVQDALRSWAAEHDADLVCHPENLYPGRATNLGWDQAADDVDILHRADNDFVFLPGWCERVDAALRTGPWAQIGLRTKAEENWNRVNVGGNCVLRRAVFAAGCRYDERPWREYPPGWTEDAYLSKLVRQMGWRWSRVREPCIVPISYESADDPYYQATWADREIQGFTRA